MTLEKSKPLSGFLEIWARTVDEGLVPRVLVTSNRHQMGKTNAMIRIQEKVQEVIHGRRFHIDDCTLTCLEFMQRRKKVGEWSPLSLDEPERPIGNKSNWDQEAMLFTEDLMTSPFRHIPALFALPHTHYLNVSIFGVCTSQIVKTSKSEGDLYEFQRDQVNRTFKTYTPNRGHISFEPCYAWDWKAYCEKREAFDTKRGKILEEKVAALHSDTKDLDKEQVYQMVIADQKPYTDSRTGHVSPSLIEVKLGVSYAKAHFAAKKINQLQRDIELAEIGKRAPRSL